MNSQANKTKGWDGFAPVGNLEDRGSHIRAHIPDGLIVDDSKPRSKQEDEFIKTLLERAGVPHELRVGRICQRFVEAKIDQDYGVRTNRVVYGGDDGDEAAREVDRLVTFHSEFVVDGPFNLQLLLEVPIECKQRMGLSVNGFSDTGARAAFGSTPTIGEFAPAQVIRSVVGKEPEWLTTAGRHSLVLLDGDKGDVAKRVSDEQLIYKSASALYDFVLAGMTDYMDQDAREAEHELLESLGVGLEFEGYLRRTRYSWQQVWREWLNQRPQEIFRDFNEEWLGDSGDAYVQLTRIMPVICVNGPLRSAKLGRDDRIQELEPVPHLFTSVRPAKWKPSLKGWLSRHHPECIVCVTNPSGLAPFLDQVDTWFQETRDALQEMPREALDRVPLEAAFYREILATVAQRERQKYRSDLDMEEYPLGSHEY